MINNKPQPKILHDWDLTPAEAIALQKKLAEKLVFKDSLAEPINYIAGVDMAVNNQTGMARAAVVLFTYPELLLVEQHTHEEPLRMPYIPGLLSFREIPCILGAFHKLRQQPDLVMVDGMGSAHPRKIGIASHLGLWIDIPTIGCGKSLLVGTYNGELLGEDAGSCVPLYYKKEVIGTVVRTRAKVNPLFISPGHLISLETSVQYVLACTKGYRLPEPVRQADKLSKFVK